MIYAAIVFSAVFGIAFTVAGSNVQSRVYGLIGLACAVVSTIGVLK